MACPQETGRCIWISPEPQFIPMVQSAIRKGIYGTPNGTAADWLDMHPMESSIAQFHCRLPGLPARHSAGLISIGSM